MRLWLATVCLASISYCGAIIYRPAPVQARPVASWLKTDKVQDRLPVRPVPTTTYRLDPHVAAINSTPERVSLPWSCNTIRQAVAGMTDEQVDRIARIYRLTKQQRVEAKKCLTKGERS